MNRTLVISILCACEPCLSAPATYEYRISYATYFGGSEGEEAREVIPLPDGSVFFGGQTSSPDLTVSPGAVQETYGGEPASTGHPGVYGGDMFVARLSPRGDRFPAATYLGGSKQERNVYGMALDREGNVVVMTATRSSDLPTTPGAYQEHFGGGPADFVAAKLSPDLRRLLWCTYVGSTDTDWGRGGLALDREDNVYLVGNTSSASFPTTPGAYQQQGRGGNDAVLVKLKADGSDLVFATRLGGSKNEDIMGVRVDGVGGIHVAGHTWSGDFPVLPGAPQTGFGGGESDGFLAGFSPDGKRLLYSTYLGGSGSEFGEHRLALLDDGSVLFTGTTSSVDFPTTAGAYQKNLRGSNGGFLAKLSPDHGQFAFATLLGGSGGEFYLWPTADASGNIFIVGSTSSQDFPVTAGALQKSYGGGGTDAVLAILGGDGSSLIYATYLGGSGDDLIRSLALGPKGEVYLVGKTSSGNFPVTSGAAQQAPGGKMDAFVVKLEPLPAAGVLRFEAAGYLVSEDAGSLAIPVTRAGGSTGAVTVDYTVSGGTATAGEDYAASPGTVTFADGEAGPRTISIDIIDDVQTEGDETVQVALGAPAGGALLGTPGSVLITIRDNDGPGGPVAHWRFDDGSGTAAADGSGNGNAGKLVNGPAWTSGRVGGALNFDGTDDYVQVPDAPELDFGGGEEFTITFWIRGSDTGDVQMVLTKRGDAGYQVWFQPNRGFFLRIDEGPNNVETVARNHPLDGRWHHVAVGRDANRHFLFIDGALDSFTGDSTLADLTNSNPLDLGNESDFPTPAFQGALDDVRVYDRALDAGEISSIFLLAVLFRRGDSNGDGSLDIGDAVHILAHLFGAAGKAPACMESADADDDSRVEITDAIFLLAHLFLGGAPPAEPYLACGEDPTPDGLTCASHPPCL